MARTRTVATVGLAGLTGLAASQTPGPLPIPDLPKVESADPVKVPSINLPDPKPSIAPFVPVLNPTEKKVEIPQIAKPTESKQPEFRLQADQAGHNVFGRETTPDPRPRIDVDPVAITVPVLPAPPRPETDTMPLDRKSVLAAALGTALSLSTSFAQDAGKPAVPVGSEKTNEAKNDPKPTAEDLKKQLADVKELLNGITAKQQTLGDTVVGKGTEPGLAKKVDDLAASIKALEDLVKKLDDKVTKVNESLEKVRTSFSSPMTKKETVVPEVAKEGIVKLINQYPDAVTLILNGKPMKLTAGETKDVKVPIGTFEYALPIAGGEIKKSEVKDNEIVTLRIK